MRHPILRSAARCFLAWVVIGLLVAGCERTPSVLHTAVPRDLHVEARIDGLFPVPLWTSVEIFGDGRGHWEFGHSSPRGFLIDTLSFRVDSTHLARVWRAIEENRFRSLAPRYTNSHVFDGEATTVRVSAGGDTQQVEVVNAYFPPFENAITAVGEAVPGGPPCWYRRASDVRYRHWYPILRQRIAALAELPGHAAWQWSRLMVAARRAAGLLRPSGIREVRRGDMSYRADSMIVSERLVDANRDGIAEGLEVDAALPLEFWRYDVFGGLTEARPWDPTHRDVFEEERSTPGEGRRVTGRMEGRAVVRWWFPRDVFRGALSASRLRFQAEAVPLAQRDTTGPYYPELAWSTVLAMPAPERLGLPARPDSATGPHPTP